MSNRTARKLRGLVLVASTGVVCSALTCVMNAADAVGTGLSLTGVSGILGPASPAATSIGSGLDFIADVFRFAGS